ncbi:serine/threonine kinase, SPS1 [Schizophyllum amplum]|uniref:Serine/threonine kinase, SPS1 n=1 Tax=Schizophyllum amplum TaxID=97359 RepID=A0A550CFV1_9AGAR|nr:serine/threonine kinase, SPS1 [Auriculariopsis ampla]
MDSAVRPFIPGSSESVRSYCELMIDFEGASHRSPLSEGLIFELTLVPPAATLENGGAGARDTPHFPFSAQATYVLVRPLQQGSNYRSQLWVAKQVFPNDEEGGAELVLKFIIPSHLELPRDDTNESFIMWGAYIYPDDVAAYQVAAYNTLAMHQGATVPYFYGAHKVTAPWGEVVSVLAIEYIAGVPFRSIRTVVNSDAPCLATLKKYRDYEHYFALFKSAIDTIEAAHANGVQHGDVRDANMLVDVVHDRIVLIDWTNDSPPHLARTGLLHDPALQHFDDVLEMCLRFMDCDRHHDRLSEYVFATYPLLRDQ